MRKSSAIVMRTVFDAVLGLILFLLIAGLIATYQNQSRATGLADILSVTAMAAEATDGPPAEGAAAVAALVQTILPNPIAKVTAGRGPSEGHWPFILMAGIFSAIFAFNLGFARHLRRAYASSR